MPGSPKMESLDSESGDTGGAGSEQASLADRLPLMAVPFVGKRIW